jgi:5-methyltetrahydrofolate--homocysteine methyltransferase
MKSITELLSEKILILDGAMGTMLQAYQFEESDFRGTRFQNYNTLLKGNNDLLTLTQPSAIREIHSQYLNAGADIIETNTFNSNRISMADYHMESLVYELNFEAAKLAKELTNQYTDQNPEKPRFVAGSIGPTNRTASMSPDVNRPGFRAVTFDELKDAYAEQIQALIDGGVDLFLVETIFDTLNAKAALVAIAESNENRSVPIPVMVSGTITDLSGRLLSGQTLEAFVYSIEHLPLLSIGLNCALGAEQLFPHTQLLNQIANCHVSVHPNAGLPNAFGAYDQSAELMANHLKPYFQENLLNIVGGCCGTTPIHIAALAELANQYKPRKVASTYVR